MNVKYKNTVIALFLTLALSCAGCSMRRMVISEVTDMMGIGMAAFDRDDDLFMLEKAFPGNIKLLEAILANAPSNQNLKILLARLYAGYTLAFVEKNLERAMLDPESKRSPDTQIIQERVNDYYQKGAEYALSVIETRYPGFTQGIRKIKQSDQWMNRLDQNDIPALFWYGFNLGGFVNQNLDNIRIISKAHIAEKAMLRTIELQPDYFHGGAHLFLMAYYGSRSPMLGGSPKKALNHYRNLQSLSNKKLLLADLYHARFYLFRQRNENDFKKTMTQILNAEPGPDAYRLLNAIAVERAKLYLNSMHTLFD